MNFNVTLNSFTLIQNDLIIAGMVKVVRYYGMDKKKGECTLGSNRIL